MLDATGIADGPKDAEHPLHPVVWSDRSTATAWVEGRVDAWVRQRAATATCPAGASEAERTDAAIQRACAQSALLGGMTGTVSTLAVAAVVSAGPIAISAAAPLAAAAAGAEVVLRAGVHAELAASIASAYGLPLDFAEPCDGARLRSLTAPSERDAADRTLLAEVVEAGRGGLLGAAGGASSASSKLRGMVPVVGIVTASIGAWRETRKLGEDMRRRLGVQRALLKTVHDAVSASGDDADLTIEGFWHLGTCAGPLSVDGHTVLAAVLGSLDAVTRGSVLRRLTDDERDWLLRLAAVPESAREGMLAGLEAIASNLEPSVPMRRLVRRITEALGPVMF